MAIADVPCFEINLDLDPEVRYLSVFVNFQENIKIIYKGFYNSIPEKRKAFFVELAQTLKKLDRDYYMEMQSLADIIDMDIHKWIAVDYICEAVTGCTSIISRMIDKETGETRIVHGRNLDYPLVVQTMRDSLYKAVFTKNGKELCVALVFAGFQGIYTGIKKNGYSISYNLRRKTENNGFAKTMILSFLGYKKWSNIIKDTFIHWDTVEEAVSYLSETPAVNPCYLTVWGIDKGAKLTKDRFKTRTQWIYAYDNEDNEENKTYDVQTNWDDWEEPPKRDNDRLITAKKLVESINVEDMNEPTMLYSILHVSPVWNCDTVYWAYMDPKTYKWTVMIPEDDK